MNRIVEWLASWLDPAERDAVLGDLTEAGAGAGQAIPALLGLIARRHRHRCLALSSLICIAGMVLSEMAFRFGVAFHGQLRTYAKYGVHLGPAEAFGREVVYLSCLFAAILTWIWASGFLLGAWSGRATWLTGTLFWVVFLDAFRARLFVSGAMRYQGIPWFLLLPFNPETFVFLGVALWAMNRGSRLRVPGSRTAGLLAGTTAMLTILVFGTGLWKQAAMPTGLPGPPTLWQLVLISLPAVYILVVSRPKNWIRANVFG